jgi:hypothetical protein
MMFMVLRIVMRAGGGGPWGGTRGRGPYGPWGGWPGGQGPGGWPGSRGPGGWPGSRGPGGWPGTQGSSGSTKTGGWPGSQGSSGSTGAGGAGWPRSGPEGGGGTGDSGAWGRGTAGEVGGGDAWPSGPGTGTGDEYRQWPGASWAWPDEDSRDWMNDPRPAAASIPDLFADRPEVHRETPGANPPFAEAPETGEPGKSED